MTYEEYMKKCSESYYDFMDLIIEELKSLKEMIKNKESIRKKSEDFKEIISSKIKIIENKSKILELNNELKDYIDLLEFLNSKNNLDNIAADEVYNQIIDDKYIKNESSVSIELENRIKELNSEIDKLNKIIDNNYDYLSLIELMDYYGFDNESKSKILFGFILKEKNLLVKREKIIVNDNANDKVNSDSNKFIQISEKEVTQELLNEFEEKLKKYKKIQDDSSLLMNEYFNKYDEHYSNRIFDGYANQTLDYIYNNLELTDEDLALVLYKKLMLQIDDVNVSISQIDENNPKTVDYDAAIFYLNEFELIYNEFIKIVKHLNSSKKDEIEDTSKVYFIHDKDNNIVTKNINKYYKKINSFISKSDMGALEGRNLRVYRLIGAENEEKYLGKMIFLLNNNISVSFTKLNDGGTLVLSVGTVDEILESTKEIINSNGNVIRNTIELIENSNKDELNIQKEIRKSIRNIVTDNMIL